MNMKLVIETIKKTRIGAVLILGYLLWIGLKDTKPQTNALPVFFVAPILLIVLNLLQISLSKLLSYLGFLTIGVMVGVALICHTDFTINVRTASISTPGTWQALILFISVIALKYYFEYQRAVLLTFKEDLGHIQIATLAIISGIFLGKALLYTFKYMISKKS